MTTPDKPSAPPAAQPEARTLAAADPRWREWYEAHGAAVYGFIRFHLPSPDDAEDLAADTFLKAFRSAGQFDSRKAGVRTWLFSIARNAVRDHRRRSRLRQHLPLASQRDLVSEHPSPEERLLWAEHVRRVLEALERLSDGDREIIGLRYGSELDPAEVAAALGIGEATARTRLWRAVERLRRALEP
ncbi:MAG: RNA polymerase sigma factor [Gemmatimonadales bacterium]